MDDTRHGTGAGHPSAALRERAEEAAGVAPEIDVAALSREEIERLVHELQVHQIELEMQNEELREAYQLLTENKREAERARDGYQRLFDHAPVGYVVLDRGGLVVRANRTLARMGGRALESIERRPFVELIDAAYHDEFRLRFTPFYKKPQGKRLEFRLGSRDATTGPYVVAEGHYEETGEGDERCLLVSLTDITQRKAAEERIALALREAEHATRAKSEFLSRMSHELRTPMNAIIGFGELLEMDGGLVDGQYEAVSHIVRAGRHLLTLINGVLDISAIESGHVEFERQPTPLSSVLHAARLLVKPISMKHRVTIHVKEGELPWVIGDEQRIKQALVNFLSNGIKYNRIGGVVTVDVKPTGDGRVRVNVHDTGEGVREEDMKGLFEPFLRFGSKIHEVEGTGIGLTITKRLIEQMDGRVGVESRYGKGSTFWFELPVAEAPAEPASAGAADGTRGRWTVDEAYSVLYVEDHPPSRWLVRSLFERMGVERVLEAADGVTGLAIAREALPDLILLDIQLPGMTGYQILDALKGDPRTVRIPVVALTANATKEDVRRGEGSGFDAYLTKPVDYDAFRRVVARYLDVTVDGPSV